MISIYSVNYFFLLFWCDLFQNIISNKPNSINFNLILDQNHHSFFHTHKNLKALS